MRFWIALAVAFLIPATAPAHENAQGADRPAAVSSLGDAGRTVDAFHDALARGDKTAVLALLADDVQIFEQGWVERSKAEYAAEHLASDIEFSAATKQVQTARSGFVTGDLAYVASEGTTTGTFKGKTIDSISIETMVLKRSPDGWRIAHIHWSSRDAKKK